MQLMIWLCFLESNWVEPGTSSNAITKMIYHALSDLLHKLKTQSVIIKKQYKFSIGTVSGLAFLAFSQSNKHFYMESVDGTILNEIIGIIDQKTA